jgi:hypothetical protein
MILASLYIPKASFQRQKGDKWRAWAGVGAGRRVKEDGREAAPYLEAMNNY